jgi:hypothetical protein
MSVLALVTAANAVLYLMASLLHTGVTISLGPLTLGFPAPSQPAAIAEGLIGAVLAIAAVILLTTRSLRLVWAAYTFALLGTLLGLSIIVARRVGGPDLWIHFVMLPGLAAGFVLLRRAGRHPERPRSHPDARHDVRRAGG